MLKISELSSADKSIQLNLEMAKSSGMKTSGLPPWMSLTFEASPHLNMESQNDQLLMKEITKEENK